MDPFHGRTVHKMLTLVSLTMVRNSVAINHVGVVIILFINVWSWSICSLHGGRYYSYEGTLISSVNKIWEHYSLVNLIKVQETLLLDSIIKVKEESTRVMYHKLHGWINIRRHHSQRAFKLWTSIVLNARFVHYYVLRLFSPLWECYFEWSINSISLINWTVHTSTNQYEQLRIKHVGSCSKQGRKQEITCSMQIV